MYPYRLLAVWAVLFLSALPCAAAPAHYLVVHEDASGRLSLRAHFAVDLAALPALPASADWEGNGNRLERRLAVSVEDAGETVFASDVIGSRWLRGEFPAAAGFDMDARHIALDEFHYVMRVPASGVLRAYRVGGRAAAPLWELDLATLADAPAATRAAGRAATSLVQSGSPANRLDLLILAEGYTADQESKFQQDAQRMVDKFLALSPYKEYRGMVNVSGLFLASAQAGASKPACAETPAEPAVSVNTALGASFCAYGSRRLVTVDSVKAYAAAAAVPDWDKLLVLVNDSEYGGSGGPVTVLTNNEYAVQLAQHEFAHSFTLLADEYETAYPGYPACSDISGTSQCEANVTDNLTRLKWQGWVASGTAVPASAALADAAATSAWLGARYLASGMYRQCYSGIMRTFSTPFFCHVDAEAFPLRLYAAGWGVPSQGIGNIDSSQPSAASVNGVVGNALEFQASVVGPESGLTATWAVGGQTQKTESVAHGGTTSFSYAPSAAGSQSVTLSLKDASPLMLTPHTTTKTWTVSASGSGTSSTTATTASYDGATQTLSLPGIDAGSLGKFQASLTLVAGSAWLFDIVSLSAIAATAATSASFDAATDTLTIPALKFGTSNYAVKLTWQRAAPGMRFLVTAAE